MDNITLSFSNWMITQGRCIWNEMSLNGLCGLSWFLIFFLVYTIHQISPAPKLQFLKGDRSYSFFAAVYHFAKQWGKQQRNLMRHSSRSSAVFSPTCVLLFMNIQGFLQHVLKLGSSSQEMLQERKMLGKSHISLCAPGTACLQPACLTRSAWYATPILNQSFKITEPVRVNNINYKLNIHTESITEPSHCSKQLGAYLEERLKSANWRTNG